MQTTLGAPAPACAAIPTDEEFYRKWFPKVVNFARCCADPEDVAQDVILDFLRAGYLTRWDATKGRNIDTFCSHMLRLRVFSALRKQRRRESHELTGGTISEPRGGFGAEGPSYEATDFGWIDELVDWRRLSEGLENETLRTTMDTIIDMVEAGMPVFDRTIGAQLDRSETAIRCRRKALQEFITQARVA